MGDPQTLVSFLEDEHNKGFHNIECQPPWRLSCTPLASDSEGTSDTVYVSFAIHHALADGVSSAIFHTCLVETLNKEAPVAKALNENVDIVHFSEALTISDTVEKRLHFPISWPFLLRALWKELTPSWLGGSEHELLWTGNAITPRPTRVHIRLIEVSSTTLSQILRACRVGTTTLTPLIHATVLSSIAKIIPASEAESFLAQTPINLRPYINRSTDVQSKGTAEFGVYVTSQDHRFDKVTVARLRSVNYSDTERNDFIWKIASMVTADLESRRKLIPHDDGIGLLPYVSDFHARWKTMFGHRRSHSWEVSNIGSMPPENDNGEAAWKITQSVFTQPSNAVGPAFNVNVSGVRGGNLCISFTWQDGILDSQLMNKMAEDMRSLLYSLVEA